MQLTAVVGSLRKDSLTRTVFEAAAEMLARQGVALTEVSLRDVPLYDGDVEAAGDPAAVAELKKRVGASDGLIVFTPEYNRSIPAVTKNALDWLSRPYGRSVLAGKPVGIVSQSPGRHDAPGVRAHSSVVVSAITDRLFEETLGLGGVPGSLTETGTRERMETWLRAFAKAASPVRA